MLIFLFYFLFLRMARVVELTANRAAEPPVRVCICYRFLLSTCQNGRRCGLICSLLFLSVHHQTDPPHKSHPHPISIPCITSASRPRLGNDRERKRKKQSESHSSNIYISLHPSQGVIPLLPTEGLMQTRLM